ncbi:MAG: hypothetical protein JO001_25510 [Alphaproteobacteria bacterium]|nr:hypothetical protein [Alphaproteobacteria bacterium]
MALTPEDPQLREAVLEYVNVLYRELSQENGAATLGTQNQTADFILTDPDLCRAVTNWASAVPQHPDTPVPPQTLPQDALYHRVVAHLRAGMETPVFERPPAPQRP